MPFWMTSRARARSSGCTRARRSASFRAVRCGARPRRAHICASQVMARVLRSSRQVPSPAPRAARAACSRALRRAIAALRCSVTSITTPNSSGPGAPDSRREWVMTWRTWPSGRTTRKLMSTTSCRLRIQRANRACVAARSAGCTQRENHSAGEGSSACSSNPNSERKGSLQCALAAPRSKLQCPMPAVRVTSSKRRRSSSVRRDCSMRSLMSMATPRQATALPSPSRCTTRRVNSGCQLPSRRRKRSSRSTGSGLFRTSSAAATTRGWSSG